MSRAITVYKSARVADMYVYVDRGFDPASLPEALLARFGKPVEVMQLDLAVDRRLARVDAKNVLEGIESQGFFLQMPPTPEAWRDA